MKSTNHQKSEERLPARLRNLLHSGLPFHLLRLLPCTDPDHTSDECHTPNRKQTRPSDLQRVLADRRVSRPMSNDGHCESDEDHAETEHHENDADWVAARRHGSPLHLVHVTLPLKLSRVNRRVRHAGLHGECFSLFRSLIAKGVSYLRTESVGHAVVIAFHSISQPSAKLAITPITGNNKKNLWESS